MDVRIVSIMLQNFKNVVFGNIHLENSQGANKTSVIGLYGQNGSGKTALIDAIELLKYTLCGMSVPDKFADYININADSAALSFDFRIKTTLGFHTITYKFDITAVPDDTAQNSNSTSWNRKKIMIKNEQIKCPILTEKGNRIGCLIDTNGGNVFLPKNKMLLLTGKINDIDMLVAKKVAAVSSRSFIFSRELLTVIFSREAEMNMLELNFYVSILKSLVRFGNYNLFIVNTLNSGLISLNAQPLIFKYGTEIKTLMLLNEAPMLIRHKDKELAQSVINSINIVLKQIVPGLTIGISEIGTQLMDNGEPGDLIQLMSRNNRITLKNESEGIKKIISILHLLIAVYNNPSITVAIDELDNGIFEYLLGELLRIISEKGKGQLIFTSHNLRPLETLDKNFVVFTTTNPKKRYVRMKNVKCNNNLRDFYYRDIMLGEQTEELYNAANNAEIAFAFREAGQIECRVKE